MSLGTTVSLVVVVFVFIIIITLTLVNQADKRRKTQQNAAKVAKKAEAAANGAAWDRLRER